MAMTKRSDKQHAGNEDTWQLEPSALTFEAI